MGRQFLKYGALLIGMYLAVAYATGTGDLITKSSNGTVGVVKAFQARG